MLPERIAQVAVGVGQAGLQFDRAAETGDRFVPAAPPGGRISPQIAVILGDVGVDAIARPISSIAASGAARLARQDTQQVQRVGMVGTTGQDLAIESLGLGQPAGP